ncbi:ABC transporter ATP-binding protein [Salinicoccus hispanicus]|uniref:ATP-binding cassette domain-containing protein n=1 Tax=Salinicoccus hispanicus TaxID=157225 RepID=A0A6N8TZ87_9STAP|nr:ABC transporter ATP-binding protein [Salinicoccus hispanicus]MXQ50016.1 ATP-binding cassette domain-containing protein [Salinicoccus hispanicus]
MKELKRLVGYAMAFKGWFALGITLMILMVSFELLGPVIAMIILDRHIQGGGGQIEMLPIYQLLAVFLGIKLLHAVFSYFQEVVLQNSGALVVQKMRNDVFQHVQKLPIRYFDDLPAGKVVARITNDTESILHMFSVVLPLFLVSSLTVGAITVITLFINIWTGLVMLLFVPIIIVWMILYRKYSNDFNHTRRERNSDINAMINESISGMPIIQVFNREEQITREFEALNDDYLKNTGSLIKLESASGQNLMGTLRSLLFAVMVYIFASSFLDAQTALSVGTMYILVDYVTRFFNPLFNIIGELDIYEQARVAAVKVFELLDAEIEAEEEDHLGSFNGHIAFNEVSFSYDDKHTVLKDISIDVSPGETVALVGHTGSGKSSIINLLMRFYDPVRGKILFDGKDTREFSKQSLRHHMSIVLQDPFIYSGSLLFNLRLNNEEISEEEARAAIISVGGGEMLSRMNQGMHTELTERGSTLSLGERQLISFARAMVFNPKVLVLDEATSNIDSETEQMIQHAMKVVSANRTTFIIAHRLSTIQHADQILLLDSGRIVESGNHEELLATGKEYAKMYTMQLGQPRVMNA